MNQYLTIPWIAKILFLLALLPNSTTAQPTLYASPFLDIAQVALTFRNHLLETPPAPLANLQFLPSIAQPIRNKLIFATRKQRTYLANHDITYINIHTDLTPTNLQRQGPTAILTATEHTLSERPPNANDLLAPPYTEYYTDLQFIFSYTGTSWKLTSYQPLHSTPTTPSAQTLPIHPDLPPSNPIAAPNTTFEISDVDENTRKTRVDYANQYWHDYNPSYANFNQNHGGGDCTNFVSQSLRASGWTPQQGWYRGNSAWWSNNVRQSWTWINGDYLLDFTIQQHRGQVTRNVSDLIPGDILLVDFDHNGSIDHTMLVTSKDRHNTIYLTYHNTDTRDRPFWDMYLNHPHALWYGIHIN